LLRRLAGALLSRDRPLVRDNQEAKLMSKKKARPQMRPGQFTGTGKLND
jgi:hypothetical protein